MSSLTTLSSTQSSAVKLPKQHSLCLQGPMNVLSLLLSKGFGIYLVVLQLKPLELPSLVGQQLLVRGFPRWLQVIELPELGEFRHRSVLGFTYCRFFGFPFQFKRLTVQLGTPNCHHVELLVSQRLHVFALLYLLHVSHTVSYTFLVS